MKRIILLVVLSVLSIYGIAQNESIPISKTEVVVVENASTEELFNRVELWAIKAFEHPDRVVKLKDKSIGQIILTPSYYFTYSRFIGSGIASAYINYTIKINFKDNRFRVELTDFIHSPTNDRDSFGVIKTGETPLFQVKKEGRKWADNVWKELQESVAKESELIMQMLVKSIKEKDSSQTDW